MTDKELEMFLDVIEENVNDTIDKLIVRRQKAVGNEKKRLSYITKKLEVVIGAIHRIQDKMAVDNSV